MQTKFTTSVNIVRDAKRELNYIPTPNAIQIVNQICSDFKKGQRSFNIIGSYGTGKSSFLWALQQSLTDKKKYFKAKIFDKPKIEFINLVGKYQSIIDFFIDHFEVSTRKNQTENILSEIYNRYHDLGKKNPLLVICIDEFGKFLEYAANNSPEKELYFIQQLSEFVNNSDNNIILLTTVHQNFDAYSYSLQPKQRQEWTKVKGRFREIAFNEPVEQLLFLASEHLAIGRDTKEHKKEIGDAAKLFLKSKAFAFNKEYIENISGKLFPLDLFAASSLTLALQNYGQNERSLFSFLESTDHTGLNKYDTVTNPFYNLSNVYDYLSYNLYTYLNSKHNPDFAVWAAIKSALQDAENTFDEDVLNYSKIIKSIGLLNLFAAKGSTLDMEFLTNYSKHCLGILNADKLIKQLVTKQVIAHRNYSKRYVVAEGTDLDIQSALLAAESKIVEEVQDVTTLLKKYYHLPPVMAKSYSYQNGTPRLFEYIISDSPINLTPKDEIDGYINLIFSSTVDIEEVRTISQNQKEAILYCYFENADVIKIILRDIEKTNKVIEENPTDKVAVRELNNILEHQKNLLNHKVIYSLYNPQDVTWLFNGEDCEINSKKSFNVQLSEICDTVYETTPEFKNELVNKHKISSQIHTAKRNFFKALVNNWNQPDLGFDEEKFPPEKTIYLTLIKNNGLELFSNDINHIPKVTDESTFIHVWNSSELFLNSAKESRKTVEEFIDMLNVKPLKLKQGLIEFWVPIFLFIKRDDFALFHKNIYLPDISADTLELIVKNPDEFEVKAFDIAGVKLDIFNSYRLILNQEVKEKLSNITFIETIRPFLKFYRDLPEYVKKTKRLSKASAGIRDAIVNSKDPEQTFYEAFPNSLGYSLETLQTSTEVLQSYSTKLQDAIRELRTCYDALIDRIEEFISTDIIGESLPFEEYQSRLQNRFKKLKRHLLLPSQKTFVERLDSKLDDKKAWLNSLTHALVGTSLEKIQDADEILLYDKLKDMILELDSLTNLSKIDIDENKEDVLGIEISEFLEGATKKLIRLPKNKRNDVKVIEEMLKKKLGNDRNLNIAALTNLLKEQLRNG